VPERGGRKFHRFEVATPGNGNGGHEYGTGLDARAKDAIVEWLKTF
jgi:hypothetical protein